MGMAKYLSAQRAPVRLYGCEPYNYPKYARFDHERSRTIADGLILEVPHPAVRETIAAQQISIHLVHDSDIRAGMRELFEKHGLIIEPSSAITTAFLRTTREKLPEPICVILTGGNITREDFDRLI
jgi:threonine dehydratase